MGVEGVGGVEEKGGEYIKENSGSIVFLYNGTRASLSIFLECCCCVVYLYSKIYNIREREAGLIIR